MLKLYPEYGRTYLDYKAEAKPELNDPNSWQWKCIDFPDTLSPKTGNHWYQQIMSSKARKYDYGEEENIKRYGSKEAPEINTSSIRDIPIALFFGKYDLVVQSNEVQFTIDHLDPSVIKHYEECESGHHTFLLGKDVSYLDSIHKLIREYSK